MRILFSSRSDLATSLAERLCRFYRHHCPDKLKDAEKEDGGAGAVAGEAAAGQEEEDQADPGQTKTKQQSNKELLVAFYLKHDAGKVPLVDKMLSLYSTEQLVPAIEKKYGAAPPLSPSGDDSPERKRKGKSKEATKEDKAKAKASPGVLEVAAAFEGKEAALNEALRAKYSGHDLRTVLEGLLEAFYARHNPAKLQDRKVGEMV